MGSDYYDYIFADKTMIPEGSKKFYSENVIYLPSYQVNSDQEELSDTSLDKHHFSLPENSFVFCCFNNTYKLTPDVFDSWSRILQQVEDSVLMLYVDNEIAKINLKEQIILRGIDSERLIFGGRVGGSEYWSRYKVVDLFLDTFLYSACATASDALRMGCPVLTLMGESFSSRFGGSLLTSLDLPELITTSQAEYEERAVYLATHPEALSVLRTNLATNLVTKPLYDTEKFAKSIEVAFTSVQDKVSKGEDADDIHVEHLKS
jgi:predicted O-linked N-acetylglucosamine transferase (SPINDLY family)